MSEAGTEIAGTTDFRSAAGMLRRDGAIGVDFGCMDIEMRWSATPGWRGKRACR